MSRGWNSNTRCWSMANATIGGEMLRGSIVFEPEEGGRSGYESRKEGVLDMMRKGE
jgi:hypothetical protein